MRLLIGIIVVLIAVDSLRADQADGDPLLPIVVRPESRPVKSPAERPAKTPKPASTAAKSPKKTAIEIDREKSRLVVRGSFLGTSGLVELGATTNRRKKFLAVILLKARPSEIARAMKALGAQPGKVPVINPRATTATRPEGRKVDLLVEWEAMAAGKPIQRRARLEEFFWDRSTDRTLPESPWVYAGSSVVKGAESDFEIFVADLSGSVATINRMDSSSLFYYGGNLPPAAARRANPQLKPRAGTPCRLVIQVLAEPEPPEPKATEPAAEKIPADQPPAEEIPAIEPPADSQGQQESPQKEPQATEPENTPDGGKDQKPTTPTPAQGDDKKPETPEPKEPAAAPASLR
ncbi:MAG: hypothetical protein GWP05_09865 [Anaerolineaceae bacterium]|nr:hypothetical protein [Anaerolineaceae bacterium]